MISKFAPVLAVLVAGCATMPPPTPENPIHHYLRTNRDGSEPEHVVQYRPSRTAIAVYKWVEKCTGAAYVTADMDDSVREGRRFVAGKVAKDGSQTIFGTLTLDPSGPALVAAIDPPGGKPIRDRHPLKSRPYLIYDFDFADLNAFLQTSRPRADFTFELPVIWPGEGAALFRDYGRLEARHAGTERHDGQRTVRFDLIVTGKTPATGTLWIDAARGHIVEAELGLPNHQEYRDFRLKLERIARGGKLAWDAMTRAHYGDCPAGN